MNYFGELTPEQVHNYKEVAQIRAADLNDAWVRSQNDFNDVYAALGIRSTSVGDIILPVNDSGKPEVAMLIAGIGFTAVPTVYWDIIKQNLVEYA